MIRYENHKPLVFVQPCTELLICFIQIRIKLWRWFCNYTTLLFSWGKQHFYWWRWIYFGAHSCALYSTHT